MSKIFKSKSLSKKNSIIQYNTESIDSNTLVGTREFAEIVGLSYEYARRLFPTIPYVFRLGGSKGKLLKIKYGDLLKYIDSQIYDSTNCIEKIGGIKPQKRVEKQLKA